MSTVLDRPASSLQTTPRPAPAEPTADDPAVVETLGDELAALASARNYRDWLFSLAAPHLGARVLEIGAGIGTMTECVADRELVVALEYTPEYAMQLRARFAAGEVEVVEGDVNDRPLMASLRSRGLDSAMTFNVLEHIEDDAAALAAVHDVLVPGGHLIALVPAAPALYGTMDRAVGHYRRYTRAELAAKARRAGFEVIDLYHVNLVGYFLWLLRGRVMRTSNITGSPRQIRTFDRLVVPRLRAMERHWRPPFGQSLVLVARRLVEAVSA